MKTRANCFLHKNLGFAPKCTLELRKKAKIWNRYNKVPQLTQGTIWESDKDTRKHYTQEPFLSR